MTGGLFWKRFPAQRGCVLGHFLGMDFAQSLLSATQRVLKLSVNHALNHLTRIAI